ncbi:MAG: transglutaminase domain-containing protein [bacterium]
MNILANLKILKLFGILTLTPILFVFSLLLTSPVFAETKTAINIHLDYQVNQNGELKTINTTKYINNTPNTVLSFSSDGKFSLTAMRKYTNQDLMWSNLNKELASLVIKINNSKKSFTSIKTSNGYEITYKQNNSIKYGESMIVTAEFLNPELIEKVGKIYNIYIPESPVIESSLRSRYELSINTTANISKLLGPIHFATENYTEDTNSYIFKFESKDSSKKTHVIQIGNSQIWKFELIQKVDLTGLLNPNLSEYKIMIPSDDPTLNQKVFYESFSPIPQKITSLPNGNLEATYYIDQDVTSISVKGYLIQSEENSKEGYLDNSIDLSKYLSAEKYWEVTDPLIVETTNRIQNGSNTMETIMNIYDFVTSKVDYDNLKLGINNTRQGAVSTLKTGSGVCMEYSDLLITLLRAKGIPSRAVFGYGYTPGENSSVAEKHQWVQAYINDTGWVSIDPTWGNTTRKFIGKDFDHFSWFVSEESVDNPKEVTSLFVGSVTGNLETPNIVVTPVGDNIIPINYMDSKEAINKYKLTQIDEIVLSIRVAIFFPYLIAGLLIITVPTILLKVFKTAKRVVEN